MKQKSPLDATKDLMGAGIGSMAGFAIMGGMSNLPGIPQQAKSITPIVGAGLTLGVTKSFLNVTQSMLPKPRKTTGDKRLDMMLGYK